MCNRRWRRPAQQPFPPVPTPPIFAAMAKPPDKPKKPRDYARPTRSKAHRPDSAPTDPALERLLNPGIEKGTAGMGSGTGLQQPTTSFRGASEASDPEIQKRTPVSQLDSRPAPSARPGMTVKPGLQPPPDNSFERRADRRNEHTARKSTTQTAAQGFDEAPQRGYVARAPLDINAELANALGYGKDDPNKSLIDDSAGEPPERDEISQHLRAAPREARHAPAVAAADHARRHRQHGGARQAAARGPAEFAASGGTAVWTPHRPPRPEKSEGGVRIELKSDMTPKGDQPTAIKDLVEGAKRHDRTQVLLGVTGSGKTFTMAKVIEATQRPAHHPGAEQDARGAALRRVQELLPRQRGRVFRLLLRLLPAGSLHPAHRHLHREGFLDQRADRPHAPFGDARAARTRRRHHRRLGVVHLRHRLGRDLFGDDLHDQEGREASTSASMIADLVATQYKRTSADFSRGTFRVRGDVIDIFPAHYEDRAWRVNLFGDEVESIHEFDPLTGQKTDELEFVKIYANSHYVTPRPTLIQAISGIKAELKWRLDAVAQLRPPARSAAARAAHAVRPGDDGRDRRLRRHRELFALSDRPQTRRAAADAVRIRARQRAGVRRREPRHRAADRRHVPRRLPPQGHARRIRLPPAVLHGQPAAALRGMGRDAAADRRRLGDARAVGDQREPAACSPSR